MKNTIWIPKPNELVCWKGRIYKVISCNLGGKCTLKHFTTTKRITQKFSDVDVSELTKIQEETKITNFKIGMKVVVISDVTLKNGGSIAKGSILTVTDIWLWATECRDCGRVKYAYECDHEPILCACEIKPLQYTSKVNFEVIAKFQPVEERSDVIREKEKQKQS